MLRERPVEHGEVGGHEVRQAQIALQDFVEEQKRLRKEKEEEAKSAKKQPSKKEKKESSKTKEEVDAYSAVYKSIFKKSTDPTTGTTMCRLGVQYVDEKVGVVSLNGKLPTKDAVDLVKLIAEKVKGVQSVDASGLTVAG